MSSNPACHPGLHRKFKVTYWDPVKIKGKTTKQKLYNETRVEKCIATVNKIRQFEPVGVFVI